VRLFPRGRETEIEMGDTTIESRSDAAPLSAKDEVRALLDRLPDTVTLEDIQYHLAVYVKMKRSEERADREGWIPHAEVERRLAKWLD
jgi:hypothetical protein